MNDNDLNLAVTDDDVNVDQHALISGRQGSESARKLDTAADDRVAVQVGWWAALCCGWDAALEAHRPRSKTPLEDVGRAFARDLGELLPSGDYLIGADGSRQLCYQLSNAARSVAPQLALPEHPGIAVLRPNSHTASRKRRRRGAFAAGPRSRFTSDPQVSPDPDAVFMNPPGVEEIRPMVAMWAEVARMQYCRLSDAHDDFNEALADSALRAAFENLGRPEVWKTQIAEASGVLTRRVAWQFWVELDYWLHTITQVIKWVAMLTSDELPRFPDEKLLATLRDPDQHRQDPGGTAATNIFGQFNKLHPGSVHYNNKHIWVGHIDTDYIMEWVSEVDVAVRVSAAEAGAPIPSPGDELA